MGSDLVSTRQRKSLPRSEK